MVVPKVNKVTKKVTPKKKTAKPKGTAVIIGDGNETVQLKVRAEDEKVFEDPEMSGRP